MPVTPERQQEIFEGWQREAREKGWATFRVTIRVDDGRTDTQEVPAPTEGRACTRAMLLTSLRFAGQLVEYDVEQI